MPKLSAVYLLLLAFTLAGCLPSSCRRTESREISPADSLSRQIAGQMTPDTLRLAWQAAGPDAAPMEYPRTLLFGPDGHLYVSDAQRHSLYTFTAGGTFVEEQTWDGAAYPYLAGLRGDTLLVFNPDAHRLDFVLAGVSVHRVPTPTDLPDAPFQYVRATDDAIYFKTVGDNFRGYLARLDNQGAMTARVTLPGPYWRHAGLLRTWDDALLSLSGFRPVIDVLSPDLTAPLDTLALVGFDSPMLARSYAFMHGDTYEAPLLSPSAVPVGDRLFVLNLRPGWLRIDVYDRAGRLQHILVQEDPGFNTQFYPMDLAVRAPEAGRYEIAVAMVKPVPEIKLYRWHAP
ncbi:MAG: hypothetical protein ACE5G0_08555 [Rhodothermales bacterium]